MFGDDNYIGLAGLGQLDQQPEFVIYLVPMVIAMLKAGWKENPRRRHRRAAASSRARRADPAHPRHARSDGKRQHRAPAGRCPPASRAIIEAASEASSK